MTQASIRPLNDSPIITPEMLPGNDGANINGPSLVRMPDHIPGVLGKYYCYFAHHNGEYIRLAYADSLAGPWTIYEPGVIPLASVPAFRQDRGHLASPDALWIGETLYVYVHGMISAETYDELGLDPLDITTGGQRTALLTSQDGIHFSEATGILGSFYMRVFKQAASYYAIALGGQLLRADQGPDKPFTFGPVIPDSLFPRLRIGNAIGSFDPKDNDRRIRHVAIDEDPQGNFWVYYTCSYEQPESIYRARLIISDNWQDWHLKDEVCIRRPSASWEGADLPKSISKNGPPHEPEHALRDPAIYREGDQVYVLWSVAGEQSIAIGQLIQDEPI